jgi:hypothetical protein
VPAYIKDACGMLGRRVPDAVADPGFPAQFAQAGEYSTEDCGVMIAIRRRQ